MRLASHGHGRRSEKLRLLWTGRRSNATKAGRHRHGLGVRRRAAGDGTKAAGCLKRPDSAWPEREKGHSISN